MHGNFFIPLMHQIKAVCAARDTIFCEAYPLVTTVTRQQQAQDASTKQANMQTVAGMGNAQPEMWRDIIMSCFRPVSTCRRYKSTAGCICCSHDEGQS
jgi:hypothetical protein